MKKKFSILGLTAMLMLGMSTTVYASGSVTFTEKNELNMSSTDLGTEFKDMAPGETKSQTVTISNSNPKSVDFYMQTEALRALEETNNASGGAYKIKLELSKDGTNSVLYDSSLGGAMTETTGNILVDDQGILGLNASEIGTDTTFLATLKNGQSANLILTVGLDGESIRNADLQNTYKNATGILGMEFLVAYRDPETKQIVTVNRVVTQASTPMRNVVQTFKNVVVAVKTGDTSAIGIFAGLLAAGTIILMITGRKKKTEEAL